MESGDFQISVGASSRDIRLQQSIVFTSSEDVREPLTLLHSLQEWLKDERYAEKVMYVMLQLNIDEHNPLYPIFLGVLIRTILSFLSSLGYPQEVVDDIYKMFGMPPVLEKSL